MISNIRIGLLDYEIKWVNRDPEFLGQSHTDDQFIEMADSLDPVYTRSILLHELLHCLIAYYGIQFESDLQEENIVNSLAPVLLELLINNPLLTNYLCQITPTSTEL